MERKPLRAEGCEGFQALGGSAYRIHSSFCCACSLMPRQHVGSMRHGSSESVIDAFRALSWLRVTCSCPPKAIERSNLRETDRADTVDAVTHPAHHLA